MLRGVGSETIKSFLLGDRETQKNKITPDFEFEYNDGRELDFYIGSPEQHVVVTDALERHKERGSPFSFNIGFVDFKGFDFQGMYENGSIPQAERVKGSRPPTLRIIASEKEFLDNKFIDDADSALWNMVGVAEMTRGDKVDEVRGKGYHHHYLNSLISLSKTLIHGSSQVEANKVIEQGDNTLTIVPLKGAALCIEESMPFLSPEKIVPINSTRVPKEDGSFGLGLSWPREDFSKVVPKMIRDAEGKNIRMFEIAVVSGKTSIGFLTYIKSLGVNPRSVEIMAPVVAQQGVEQVLDASNALGLKTNIVTYEIFHDLEEPDGNDSIRTSDGRLVLGNPPNIVGRLAWEKAKNLEHQFIEAHNLPRFY